MVYKRNLSQVKFNEKKVTKHKKEKIKKSLMARQTSKSNQKRPRLRTNLQSEFAERKLLEHSKSPSTSGIDRVGDPLTL